MSETEEMRCRHNREILCGVCETCRTGERCGRYPHQRLLMVASIYDRMVFPDFQGTRRENQDAFVNEHLDPVLRKLHGEHDLYVIEHWYHR